MERPSGYQMPTPVYIVGDGHGGVLAAFASEDEADRLFERLHADAPGTLQITILPVYRRVEDWEYGS